MNDTAYKLLIVDDEPNIRTGLCKGLQGEAEFVETAADGEEGLQKFQQQGHDVVITDVRLPGDLDGLAAQADLR